ncbi:FAD-dependent oxidoreductase [Algibacillus agarilyticus]|uniref:FAD-dependent oxidoreductase n=1 Tax=Algibacillus agarilyticus TaxID=2234133 RepID=UPI000DCFA94E|nr:FAD-dependent oxidoreductase [Algibacillus agarilyticus]
MANIAIVGAGLMGRLLALLITKQHQVTLYEQGELNTSDATGRIAAAMIAPTAESVVASDDIVYMGHASLALWPDLLSYLDLDVTLQQAGTIILAHRQDEADLLSFKQRVKLQTSDDLQTLTAAELHLIEPEISSQFAQIVYLPNEGQIYNDELYQASAEAILKSDITLKLHTEIKLNNLNRCIQGNSEPLNQLTELPIGKQVTYDWVIDCRGLGAKSDLLNVNKALRGVRGEVIRVKAPEVNITRPVRLMHPRYPLYIVPKGDHEYVIGATEIESEDNKPSSVRSALELLSAAYSVHKGFAEASIESMKVGLRPTLNDNEPSIDVSQSYIQINGLYRHGYLLAPYLLQQVLEQLNCAMPDELSFSQQHFNTTNQLVTPA